MKKFISDEAAARMWCGDTSTCRCHDCGRGAATVTALISHNGDTRPRPTGSLMTAIRPHSEQRRSLKLDSLISYEARRPARTMHLWKEQGILLRPHSIQRRSLKLDTTSTIITISLVPSFS
ncbi:hypothetical protein J6590_047414 [Homalodisca vitripennis]|nr:hypothetical protein J6590_047414 [Homalodisca vitripennis]